MKTPTLFAALLLAANLLAQRDKMGFQRFQISNFGFRANTVATAYHDPLGYLWFCNLGGLDRWDGINLKHYPYDRFNPRAMPEPFVFSILMDKTGKYWLNSQSCFSILDPALPLDSAVTRILRAPNNTDLPPLTDLHTAALVADENGNFWLPWLAQKGLLYIQPERQAFDLKKIQSELGDEDFNATQALPDSASHRVWLSSRKHGFCSMDTRDFRVTHFEKDVKAELQRIWQEKDDILLRTNFFWAKKGYVWCLANGKPFVQFDLKTRRASVFEGENCIFQGRPEVEHEYFLEDYRGNFWFTNANTGLQFLDMAARRCRPFLPNPNDATALLGNMMNPICADRQGNIWICQRNAGVARFNYNVHQSQIHQPFPPPPPEKRTDYFIYKCKVDAAGNEFLSTNCCFFVKPAGTDSFQQLENIRGTDFQFNTPDGKLWHIGEQGIREIVPSNPPVLKKHPVQPRPEVLEIFEKAKAVIPGRGGGEPALWVAKRHRGLFRYFIERGTAELVSTDTAILNLASDFALTVLQCDSKNRVWLLLNQGFARFDPATSAWEKWIYDPADLRFMAIPQVRDFLVDKKDRVWFASIEGGAVWFDGVKFHNASRMVPGAIPRCYTVAERENGEIWFGNNKNVASLVPETGKFKIYNNIGGSLGISFKNDSTAIFHGFEAMIYFPADHPKALKIAPRTIVSTLHIFETDRSDLLRQTEITLPHDQNYLKFTFGNFNFVSPEGTHFKWKLEGADADWVEPKDNPSSVNYSTLPPGHYVFRVKSCNADGIWDETGTTLNIQILPPWWQTWWFRLLAFAAAAVLVWSFFQQRTLRKLAAQRAEIEKTQALARERERIARDMHDDLGSGLSAIQLLSNFVKNRPPESIAEVKNEVEKIASSSAELNQRIREIIWTVNSEADTAQSLADFLKRYCADFQENTKIETQFEVLPDLTTFEKLSNLKLSGEQRRNVFLCAKEALNNAAKHAGATEIDLKMFVLKNGLRLEIRDNGRGFDFEKAFENGGNGLRNIQRRMAEIGGLAAFESENGCLVRLDLIEH